MPKFEVEITETLQDVVVVEAKDEQEALLKVRRGWDNGTYILYAENFMGVEFYVLDENCNCTVGDWHVTP